jgi:hypothetical protein
MFSRVPDIDEPALLSAAKAGDERAFDRLVESYRGVLQPGSCWQR